MKLIKACALLVTVFATLACSNTNKETFVPDFTQYPLCVDSDSPSVVFIDIKSGKEVSKKYYEAYPFYNGLAVVKTSNGWTYVNKNFEQPISDYYLDATHFSEGVAFTVKKGGQINAINEKAKFFIRSQMLKAYMPFLKTELYSEERIINSVSSIKMVKLFVHQSMMTAKNF